VIDEAVPDAEQLLTAQIDAISAGVGVEPAMDTQEVIPWWSKWMPSYTFPNDPNARYKNKSAYLRKGLTDRQLAVLYRYLSGEASEVVIPMGCLLLTGFGGKVNTVASDATAIPQRDSILKAMYSTGFWLTPDEDDTQLAWVRE